MSFDPFAGRNVRVFFSSYSNLKYVGGGVAYSCSKVGVVGVVVAKWLRSRTCVLEVPGSHPGSAVAPLGKARIYARV